MAQGYGAGMWCTDQVRTGRRARGKTIVVHALIRRASTPRGTLRGGEAESTYGLDICGFLGAVGAEISARAIPVQLRAEWLKDDRVQDVSIAGSIVIDTDGNSSVDLDCQILLIGETESFPLTLSVSEAGIAIKGSTV